MPNTLYTLRDGQELIEHQIRIELRFEGEEQHRKRNPKDTYLASHGYWFCPICFHEVDNLNWKDRPEGAPAPGYLCLRISCGATGLIDDAIRIWEDFYDLMIGGELK